MKSTPVSIGDVIIASQYNNLREDALLLSFASTVYNDAQQLTQATINGAVHTFTYNYFGGLATVTDTAGTYTFVYDDVGNLKSITFA